ncbi:hypothetical protein CUU62_05355 [Pseudomonas sp. WP001]|nr:hypothetical protein CUU62_05355 [Pseudomonas sp. WP001]
MGSVQCAERRRQTGGACPDVVGASLLAKNSQAPRSFRKHALSLRFFASKLAPTVGISDRSMRATGGSCRNTHHPPAPPAAPGRTG